MEATEILALNDIEILAVFLGYKVGKLSGWISGSHRYAYKKDVNGEILEAIHESKLNFHTDWNRLIECAEKFNSFAGKTNYPEPFNYHRRLIDTAIISFRNTSVALELAAAIRWFYSLEDNVKLLNQV